MTGQTLGDWLDGLRKVVSACQDCRAMLMSIGRELDQIREHAAELDRLAASVAMKLDSIERAQAHGENTSDSQDL